MKIFILLAVFSIAAIYTKAQSCISKDGICFYFIQDTINFNHKTGVIFTNRTDDALLIYNYLSPGKKVRYANYTLEFEEKIDNIYTAFNGYTANYDLLYFGDDSIRSFDLPKHQLAAHTTDTLNLKNVKFGRYISDARNPTHEFRVKALMRVAFINNNAPKEPGDQNDYIEYKESPWFYYRSKY